VVVNGFTTGVAAAIGNKERPKAPAIYQGIVSKGLRGTVARADHDVYNAGLRKGAEMTGRYAAYHDCFTGRWEFEE